jgi:hypothetical protein
MISRRVFITKPQKYILSTQVLLHQHVKLRLGSIVWHFLSFDIDLFFSPNGCLLVSLLLFLLLFFELHERFLCRTALNVTVERFDLDFSIWLGHFFLFLAVDWVDGGTINVAIVVVLIKADHFLKGVNSIVIEHFLNII